jgi:putative effector of murein hydrolase
VGTALLGRLGVKDAPSAGLALGVASHGLGTARAFELGPSAGAFAGLGMGLNALATSVLVPLLARWLVP